MKTKINYKINESYNMKKIETDFYKNKLIDIKTINNYADPMLN